MPREKKTAEKTAIPATKAQVLEDVEDLVGTDADSIRKAFN